ncbi:MAG: ATP-binding protein [Spirochaetales bacterium]|nr:ATP-binding protein [Spirochaetales bacterium]
MSKIKIQNFGPIKAGCIDDDGWIDIKKVTLFIGNQGSGKSVVAKLISTFMWIEKALERGDYSKEWFEEKNRLENNFLPYHRLENYFLKSKNGQNKAYFEYLGNAWHITYDDNQLILRERNHSNYHLPQIMYVPAERNFIAYMRSLKELKLFSESLKEFLTEFNKAKRNIKETISLPINDVNLEYDELKDITHVRGVDYKLSLWDSSSGLQSLAPLFLVSFALSHSILHQSKKSESMSDDQAIHFKEKIKLIVENASLTDEQKRLAITALSTKFNKTAFINIVEEPEQNLFPASQWDLLKSLLEFNNQSKGNKLILTTHSPYILNYLSIVIQAAGVHNKIKENQNLRNKLEKIVPAASLINAGDAGIYQFDEEKGTVSKLKDYKGIPSDDNRLNNILQEGNVLFDKLLEIEEEL